MAQQEKATAHESVRRNALDGDHEAICAHLLHAGIDPAIVAQLRKRRDAVETTFEHRVRAILYYRKRRFAKIARPEIIGEMVRRFPLPSNVCEHLADGRGYSKEHHEATARTRAEAESNR
jgi:hypothetical protein